jgi:hypothetical protein
MSILFSRAADPSSKDGRQLLFSTHVSARLPQDQTDRKLVYRTLQFHERGQNFFGAHDETLSVDMSVYNPDRSPPSESIADTQPQLH